MTPTSGPEDDATAGIKVPPEVRQAMRFAASQFSKYTIVKLLGTGGMGAVYLAWDNELRRYVALKFLTVGTEENIRRFVGEAQTAARLNHPCIAQVYDAGEIDGRHYIAMEYVDGLTLDMLPESVRRNEIGKIVAIVRDVARALDYAHSQGVVHRDLKPQNVMLDGQLKPRITDFGLARMVNTDELRARTDTPKRITLSGTVIGTPNYIAPEQARGETRLDPRMDVYSLGATLYALVTGIPPFDGPTPLDTLMDVIQKEAAPPISINPNAPRDLDTVIMRCLEKEPERRYKTAGEVADELERIISGEPIKARPARLVQTVRRLVRKRPTTTAVLVSALLFVSMVAYFISRELRLMAEQSAKALASQEKYFQQQLELQRQAALRAQAQKIVEDARGEVERAEQMLILPGFDPQALSKAVDNAAAALTNAMQIDPHVSTAYSLRGRAFALRGDLDRAIEDFTRAIELDQGSVQARMLRGLAHLRRGFRLRRAPRLLTMLGSHASWNAIRPTAEANAAFGAAADDFDRVKAPAGGFAAAFAAGARALAAGDGEGAVSALSRASLLDPQNADAVLLLGIADMTVGWDEKAEDRFKVALIIRPNWAEARMWRAAARNCRGLDESAVEDAKAGLAIQPADPDLLILADQFDEAARRYPKDAIALACGGDVQAAVRLGGEGIEALNVLCARARLASGDTEGAREFALKAIEANPDYAPAHTVMAALHRAGGRIEEARESLDRALKLDPADPEALKLQGEMKEGQDAREAEELFKKMQEKLLNADTVQFAFSATAEAKGHRTAAIEGSLWMEKGDKMRLEIAQGDLRVLYVSDGAAGGGTQDGQVRDSFKTPKGLNENLLRAWCTGGFMAGALPWITRIDQRKDNEGAKISVSGFKMGAKENDAQAVEFGVALGKSKETIKATLWIDTKIGLPAKIFIPKTGDGLAITETFSEMKLDEKIDASKFEVPKK